ncbi:MAG: hypothetical protein FJ271_04595 [Planctomycetes bacterium]|nr:hypothetical protein [Planctomycetota bacterium]
MTTTFDKTLQDAPALNAEIKRANEMLESIAGPSKETVTASWKIARENGAGPVVELTLSDYLASAHATFANCDLRDAQTMRKRLSWLWGDLLQERSHRQRSRLNELVAALEDD